VSAPVVIVDYDPRWPALYEEEKDRIVAASGPVVLAIEHIGSTAVPGLAAKPIIDIMAGVRTLDEAPALYGPLATIGYEYAPEFEETIPERRFFRKGRAEYRTHHLHVVNFGDEFWVRHLLFREYLRRHTQVAHDYKQLKRKLAKEYGGNRQGYTEAKTDFIRGIEFLARADTELAGKLPVGLPQIDVRLARDGDQADRQDSQSAKCIERPWRP
jgi:GrpB-like predicted nucleotidyltransferase (UPF0157 family)